MRCHSSTRTFAKTPYGHSRPQNLLTKARGSFFRGGRHCSESEAPLGPNLAEPHTEPHVELKTLTPVETEILARLQSLEKKIGRTLAHALRGDSYAPGRFLKIHFSFLKSPLPKWGHLKIFVDWVPQRFTNEIPETRTFYILPFTLDGSGLKEFNGPMLGNLSRYCKDEIRGLIFKESDMLVLLNRWRQETGPLAEQSTRKSFYHLAGPFERYSQ